MGELKGVYKADGTKVELHEFDMRKNPTNKTVECWSISFGTEQELGAGTFFICGDGQIESILFCSDGFYMSYGRKVYKYIALQDFNFEYAIKVYAWMKVASRDKASDKRHKIIRKLEELLRLTDENVKGLEYIEEKDTIIIHYTDKSSSLVNVALDSGIALIKDVVGMI